MLRTIKQLAEFIGVSDVVVRSWIQRRGLPVIKIRGRIYIQDEDYARWLEENQDIAEQGIKENTPE